MVNHGYFFNLFILLHLVCEKGGDDCVKTANEEDRTVYRYRDELLRKVKERLERLSNICQLQHLLEY
jgi:hypothetical protein